jgi:ATP-dependent exoDNAse (exonuclease V) alpha subunit
VALSGIAAENLESGSGVASRTIASMEHGWQLGRDPLTTRDVLVIDEAGMVGTRQLERVLSNAAEAGAKVVLVGDIKQLQSIEAGAAFRSIHERHGGAEIGEVRRQREDWQRDAISGSSKNVRTAVGARFSRPVPPVAPKQELEGQDQQLAAPHRRQKENPPD